MTNVLIAVDDTETSLHAARVAHRLFGDGASYTVVNVTDTAGGSAMAWGYTYPVSMPMLGIPMAVPGADEPGFVETAKQTAAEVAQAADLPRAETEGHAGDVVTAVLDAAHRHQADVIVVGSHERSWLSRLLSASVRKTLVKEADVPVLVVR